MSLNALFRYPNIYTTAVSVAPVPDMHLYDTIYQERYMDTPTDNPIGYIHGSPVQFVKNMLESQNLLLVHGTFVWVLVGFLYMHIVYGYRY